MKIDAFMTALELGEIKEQLSEDSLTVLCGQAEAFLRAGGQVTWDFWKGLNPVSKAALVHANNDIWRERANLIALALKSTVPLADEETIKDNIARGSLDEFSGKMMKEMAK